MNISVAYIAVSIVVLVIVAILFFLAAKGRREARLTPLTMLAFGFMLAGMFAGDDRLVGYGLIGIGVVIAIVDIVKGLRKGTRT